MKTMAPVILVVDDEPSVLITYRLILEQQGYTVLPAATSEEALRAMQAAHVDLLLCDLSLETETSGFAVIEQARRLQPDAAVVLLTGYADHESTTRAERADIPVLFKPVDMPELLQTIANIVKGKPDGRSQTSAQ